MNPRNSDRIIAILATAIIASVLILSFVWLKITAPEISDIVVANEHDELVLQPDEYVIPEDLSQVDTSGGTELKEGDDPSGTGEDEAAAAKDDRVATAKEEVKTPPAETPSKGDKQVKTSTKQDKEAKEAEARAKAEKEKAEKEKAEREARAAEIRNNVKFNGNGSNPNDGKQGVQNGNNSSGATVGSPGHNLSGRTPESWGRPTSTKSGQIKIRVKVNAQGHVTSASYVGGTGAASGDAAVRRSCEQASLKSRFSVSTDNTVEQMGVITWTFK